MTTVLPLPVNALESYFLMDDRPGYRMQFVLELTFDGEIDREAFEVGLSEVLERHPMLHALLERRRFGRNWWVPAGSIAPAVDWDLWHQPIQFPVDPGFDLRREPGLRCFVRVGDGQSKLTLQFHHACCDGVGAIQFAFDWTVAYVRHLQPNTSTQPSFMPVNTERLRKRLDVDVYTDESMSWWSLAWHFVKLLWHQNRHEPSPFSAPKTGIAGPTLPFPETLTRTLQPGAHTALRKIARRNDTTLHELLLRELLLTMRDWNERQDALRPSDHFAVLVPVNLRTHEFDDLPAANLMGYVSHLRAVAEMQDPDRLLESLRVESEFFRRWRYAATFVNSMKVLTRIPGAMEYIYGRDHCYSTAVLSTIGDPSRLMASRYPLSDDGNPILANLVLTDVNSAPPLRPLTRASFSAWHFSDKQRLGLRCDPNVFDAEHSQQLLDVFGERVAALAETAIEKRKRIAA